jgi:hypothetical protein
MALWFGYGYDELIVSKSRKVKGTLHLNGTMDTTMTLSPGFMKLPNLSFIQRVWSIGRKSYCGGGAPTLKKLSGSKSL